MSKLIGDELVVVEQKEVEFYGDNVIAVRLSDGTVYVPVRPLVELLGIAWSAQRNRINRDPVLSDAIMSVIVTITDIKTGSRRPKSSEMLCLPLEYISGFLFGVNATRVKPELKTKVIQYQKECYKVLSEAFWERRLTVSDVPYDELLAENSPAAQAVQLAQAVLKMAKQQLVHEAKLLEHEGRIEQLESQVSTPNRLISSSQASQISQAVKAIAMELARRSRKNEYGGVYGELYRQFEITSYKELPASRYSEAIDFLTEWHQSIVSDSPF